MNKQTNILLFGFLLLSLGEVFSQNTDSRNFIRVLSNYKKGYVKLRWAPSSPSAWRRLNEYGYEIERITVKRNGKLLPAAEEKKILATVKAKPLEDWKSIVNTNDKAVIVAQLLYGKDKNTHSLQGIERVIHTSKDMEQKYAYVLIIADTDFEVATMAGLGYMDTDVEENVQYLYRVKSLAPKLKIETGLKLANTEKEDILPSPIDVFPLGGNKQISLSWDKEVYKSIFTAYQIEKSEDSINFKRIDNLPFINFNDDYKSNTKQMTFTDSIAENYKPYYYRIIGISSFGEESPPSKTITAMGVEKLEAIPKITAHKVEGENILLKWSFDQEAEKQIQGFAVAWAPKEEGPYQTIKTSIPKKDRIAKLGNLKYSNYYKIKAIGISHQKTTSRRYFAQTEDATPPRQPVGLKGFIDSLGVVKLSWQANTESDLKGYHIYKGNIKNEFVPATTETITENFFIDTLNITMLNSKVYYKIKALDKRFNVSDFSEKIELTKPDVIPPTAPVFKEYKVTGKGVFLQWINSSSEDVVAHKLYRKQIGEQESDWQQIFTTDTLSQYTDMKVLSGVKYRYAIYAEDDSKLQSDPSTPITITTGVAKIKSVIKGLNAFPDREAKNITVTWRTMPKQVVEVLVYKAKNKEAPVLWKQIPPSINKLIDTGINPDNTYVYTLKTVFSKGIVPQIKTIEVTY